MNGNFDNGQMISSKKKEGRT